MSDVASEGRTVLFVSHNMGAIANLCEDAIWLLGGSVHRIGTAQDVIAAYLGSHNEIEKGSNIDLKQLMIVSVQI